MATSETTAFILAGGRGSRLAPLTTVIPKPLVPVGNSSILEILVRQLARQGITRIVVSLGYLGHLIEAVIGDGSRLGADVAYTREPAPLGTAGAMALLPRLPDGDHVLVLNGDTLTDLDFAALVGRHAASGAAATAVVQRRSMTVDFGVVELGPDDELAAYVEKPTYEHLISIGINVFRAETLGRLAGPAHLDMPAFLMSLKDGGLRVRCDTVDCFWLDLGRFDDLRAAADIAEQHPERFDLDE